MKSIGYIMPHLIHELWDVCDIKDLKNINSQNVFFMSMKNVACKIDNLPRNPLDASILWLDSRWEETNKVNCDGGFLKMGWIEGVGSDLLKMEATDRR
jgi:hypothetical protein